MKQVEARGAAVEEEDHHALKDDSEKIEDAVEIPSGKTSQILVDKKKEEEENQHDQQQQEQQLLLPSLLLTGEFGNNDTKVLQLLNEAGSNYSFKGLMRKLNLHQQSLSRALHRLQEMGLVERTASGYRLGNIMTTATSINNSAQKARRPKGIEYTQLLQTYVPVNVKSADVIRQLVGRWFKNMRWLGMIESETGHTLQWTSEDGSFQINLRLISDYVIIETNASTEKEKVQAMSGSYAIYEQITRAVQSRLLAAANSPFRLDYHRNVNN